VAKSSRTVEPIIGITCQTDLGVPGADPVKHSVNAAYVQAVEESGGTALLLPCLRSRKRYRRLLDLLEGLLVTGGADLDPRFFHQEPRNGLGRIDAPRDNLEAAILPEALRRDLPILGICRGIQSLNVFAGGTLYQDLSEAPFECIAHRQTAHRTVATHDVILEKDSRLYAIMGRRRIRVNSTHHQAIKDVAPGFVVTGRARDGVIEAIEREGARFCIGVQWHPEELFHADPPSCRLFKAFVEAAGRA